MSKPDNHKVLTIDAIASIWKAKASFLAAGHSESDWPRFCELAHSEEVAKALDYRSWQVRMLNQVAP